MYIYTLTYLENPALCNTLHSETEFFKLKIHNSILINNYIHNFNINYNALNKIIPIYS